MTTRFSRCLGFLAVPILGILVGTSVLAREPDQQAAETAAGWAKSPKNPVLGGDLGTCFDVSVLKEDGTDRRQLFFPASDH
jgi:hypothetical protein